MFTSNWYEVVGFNCIPLNDKELTTNLPHKIDFLKVLSFVNFFLSCCFSCLLISNILFIQKTFLLLLFVLGLWVLSFDTGSFYEAQTDLRLSSSALTSECWDNRPATLYLVLSVNRNPDCRLHQLVFPFVGNACLVLPYPCVVRTLIYLISMHVIIVPVQ